MIPIPDGIDSGFDLTKPIPRTLGSMSHRGQLLILAAVTAFFCFGYFVSKEPPDLEMTIVTAVMWALVAWFFGVTTYFRAPSDGPIAIVDYWLLDAVKVFSRRKRLSDDAYSSLQSRSLPQSHSGGEKLPKHLHRVFIVDGRSKVTVKCFYSDESRAPWEAYALRDALAEHYGFQRRG
ncbi:hypothetical protein MalM25_32840 [Planctomycetes bacterium MalM25]|nr:hypothetical protein MalM25_32840 [Planctomycetes bacterium MalM25]